MKKVFGQSSPNIPIEHCSLCGDPSGRAGASDDSLFCAEGSCGEGPMCEDCYNQHCDEHNEEGE